MVANCQAVVILMSLTIKNIKNFTEKRLMKTLPRPLKLVLSLLRDLLGKIRDCMLLDSHNES